MQPHKHYSLLKQPHLLTRHPQNLLYRPAKELLPSPGAPKQFACCDTACFVHEETDDAWVEGEGERFVAVAAGGGKGIGVDCYSAAGRRERVNFGRGRRVKG